MMKLLVVSALVFISNLVALSGLAQVPTLFKLETFAPIASRDCHQESLGSLKSNKYLTSSTLLWVCPEDPQIIVVKNEFGFKAFSFNADSLPQLVGIESFSNELGPLYQNQFFGSLQAYNKTENLLLPQKWQRLKEIETVLALVSQSGNKPLLSVVENSIPQVIHQQQLIEKTLNQVEELEVETTEGEKISCHVVPNCPMHLCQVKLKNGQLYQAILDRPLTTENTSSGDLKLISVVGNHLGPELKIKNVKIVQPDEAVLFETPEVALQHFPPPSSNTNTSYSSLEYKIPSKRLKKNIPTNSIYEKLLFTYPQYLKNEIVFCPNKAKLQKWVNKELKAIDKIKKVLQEQQLVQVVSTFNQVTETSLISKKNLPDHLCQIDKTSYVTSDLYAEYIEHKNQLQQPVSEDQVIGSMEQAQALFNEVARNDNISYKYINDGCYARSHLIATELAKQGYAVQKVWLTGNLSPQSNPFVLWGYHTAPVVMVRMADGRIQKMVFDPSLSDKPLTVEEWIKQIIIRPPQDPLSVIFPPPRNDGRFLERSTLSFSTIDQFAPEADETRSDQELMEEAIETNQENLDRLHPPAASREGE